ncbi:hypothetical protein EST38_g11874 [Candolleomyces aberdarensis]|uniref:Protein kinase domain-containing protein n=1 Tax=Candolleomyces aberdarensis TaxID=2316362 RepID=A0A4Q2D6F5_9AGAR|nr:hypothetical protein EST38_g11874 [Candolleomyces aberdarensis]
MAFFTGREDIAGIPSIVTDFVKFGCLEYTEAKDFGARLNIVQQLGNGPTLHSFARPVHGDLKPDHFRITEYGVVQIIDPSLARYETNEHTGLTTLILPFVAPELPSLT